MDCLINIIGLSETNCACYPLSPVDYNTSASGIFLDQLEGLDLEMIKAVEDCAEGNLWDRMTKARDNAVRAFKADYLSCVQSNYINRVTNWSGLIGSTTFNASINPLTSNAGIKVTTNQLKGGVIIVKKIGVIVDSNVAVTVNAYSSKDGGTLVATYVINAIANTLTYATLSAPLELPTFSYDAQNLSYYFLIDLTPANFLPKNNKKDCGCGGVSKPYKSWFDFVGVKGNAIPDISLYQQSTSNEINGLVLDVEAKCKSSEIICSEERPLDFNDSGYDMQIAYAIRFKAGEILIEDMLASGNINRFTMLDRERLWGKRNHYRKLYDEWVTYLCASPKIDNNYCLVCRNDNGLLKRTILS